MSFIRIQLNSIISTIWKINIPWKQHLQMCSIYIANVAISMKPHVHTTWETITTVPAQTHHICRAQLFIERCAIKILWLLMSREKTHFQIWTLNVSVTNNKNSKVVMCLQLVFGQLCQILVSACDANALIYGVTIV